MTTDREQRLAQVRRQNQRWADADCTCTLCFLLEEITTLEDRVENGLSAAVWLGSTGSGVTYALSGDPGAVVESDVRRGDCA